MKKTNIRFLFSLFETGHEQQLVFNSREIDKTYHDSQKLGHKSGMVADRCFGELTRKNKFPLRSISRLTTSIIVVFHKVP